jgi:hypothetical protein
MILGKPGNAKAFGGQIDLRRHFLGGEVDAGKQRLQLAQTRGAGSGGLRAAENDSQIRLQAALDGVIEREIDGLRGGRCPWSRCPENPSPMAARAESAAE